MAGLKSEISVSKQSIKELTNALEVAKKARESVEKAGANARKAIANATTRATNAINLASQNLEKAVSSISNASSMAVSSQKELVSESKHFLSIQTETRNEVMKTRKEMDATVKAMARLQGMEIGAHWRANAMSPATAAGSMIATQATANMYAAATMPHMPKIQDVSSHTILPESYLRDAMRQKLATQKIAARQMLLGTLKQRPLNEADVFSQFASMVGIAKDEPPVSPSGRMGSIADYAMLSNRPRSKAQMLSLLAPMMGVEDEGPPVSPSSRIASIADYDLDIVNRMHHGLTRAPSVKLPKGYLQRQMVENQANALIGKAKGFSMEGLGKTMSAGLNKVTRIALPIAIVAELGKQFAVAGKQVIGFADDIMWANTKLHTLNDGSRTHLELQNEIADSAVRMRMDYVSAADTVRLMASSTFDLLESNDQQIEFAELFNKTLMISGTTGQSERLSAINELSKNFARGKTTPHGFARLVQDNFALIEMISKDQGIEIKELIKMGVKGEVTTEMMMHSLIKHRDEIDKAYENLPKTFTDYKNKLKAEVAKAYLPLAETVSNTLNTTVMLGQSVLSSVMGAIFKAIEVIIKGLIKFGMFVKNNIQHIVFGFKILAAVIAIKLLPLIITLISKMAVWIAKQVAAAAIAVGGWLKTAGAMLLANWQLLLLVGMLVVAYALWESGNPTLQAAAIAIGLLAAAYTLLRAQVWLTNIVMAKNPIFLKVVAVLLLITAISWLIAKLWKLHETSVVFATFANLIVAMFMNIIAAVKWFGLTIYEFLKYQFVSMGPRLRSFFQAMLNTAVLGPLSKLTQAANDTFGTNFKTFSLFNTDDDKAKVAALTEEWEKKQKELNAELGASTKGNLDWVIRDRMRMQRDIANRPPEDKSLGILDRMRDALALVEGKIEEGLEKPGVKGNIRGKVSLEKEDLKLLKEIAQSEYINKITKLTPNLQVTFGDVRETADINVIMDTIADMVETSYAHTLVF